MSQPFTDWESRVSGIKGNSLGGSGRLSKWVNEGDNWVYYIRYRGYQPIYLGFRVMVRFAGLGLGVLEGF